MKMNRPLFATSSGKVVNCLTQLALSLPVTYLLTYLQCRNLVCDLLIDSQS